MKPHHFALIFIGIVTSLLISLSAISKTRATSAPPSTEVAPESTLQMPWGGGS